MRCLIGGGPRDDFQRLANVLKYFESDRVYRGERFWHSPVFSLYPTHQIKIGTMSRLSKWLTPIFHIQSHPLCPGYRRKTLLIFLRYPIPHRNQTNSKAIDTQDTVQALSPAVPSALTLHVHNTLGHLFGIFVFLYKWHESLSKWHQFVIACINW